MKIDYASIDLSKVHGIKKITQLRSMTENEGMLLRLDLEDPDDSDDVVKALCRIAHADYNCLSSYINHPKCHYDYILLSQS